MTTKDKADIVARIGDYNFVKGAHSCSFFACCNCGLWLLEGEGQQYDGCETPCKICDVCLPLRKEFISVCKWIAELMEGNKSDLGGLVVLSPDGEYLDRLSPDDFIERGLAQWVFDALHGEIT